MCAHTNFWMFGKFAKHASEMQSNQVVSVSFCFLFLSEPGLNVILSFLDQKNQEKLSVALVLAGHVSQARVS